jgi:hypothetical protein
MITTNKPGNEYKKYRTNANDIEKAINMIESSLERFLSSGCCTRTPLPPLKLDGVAYESTSVSK